MNLDVLIPLAWTLWGILLVVSLAAAVVMTQEPHHSPEVGVRFGLLVIALLCFLMAGVGASLYCFTQSESRSGILTMMVLLGYLVIMLVAQLVTRVYKRWSVERGQARAERFREPALKPFAAAIEAGDGATLTRLLRAEPPPPSRGHDLLGYALVALRDRDGSLDCVHALLEAGCDPSSARLPDRLAPIHFMIVDITPGGREAVSLLLQHGADPNAVDPMTGNTPIRESGDSPDLVRALVAAGAEIDRVQSDGVTALVNYVGCCHWESARYLVERGARLGVANGDGLSLDYYLKSWKDGVFGDRSKGWDRLRAAIASHGGRLPNPE